MRRILLIFLIIVLSFKFSFAQKDTQFSNNSFNHIIYNPAYLGVNNKWNISGLFRTQWTGLNGSPSVSGFSLDFPFRIVRSHHGFGISFTKNEFGNELQQKNTTIAINYAIKTNVWGGICSIGIRSGFINQIFKGKGDIPSGSNKNFQRSLIENTIKGDGVFDETNLVFDLGLGLFYTKNNFYLGLSIDHLAEPSFFQMNDFDMKLKRQYNISAGFTYSIANNWAIAPSLLAVSDLDFYQVTGGMNCIFDKYYWMGVLYRQDDAVSINIGIEFKNGMRFAYAYDLGVSKFSRKSNGSHELIGTYSFDIRMRKQKYSSVRFL
ncbi:MAG: PorP/SprF family type IX secretion system membrane protein [Marinifilaceae bacterium]